MKLYLSLEVDLGSAGIYALFYVSGWNKCETIKSHKGACGIDVLPLVVKVHNWQNNPLSVNCKKGYLL